MNYEKIWQRHLEKQLGLKPVKDNGYGGKTYELPKSRIKPPRAPRKLSLSAKKKLAERLHAARDERAQNLVPVAKSATKAQSKGNSIPSRKKG